MDLAQNLPLKFKFHSNNNGVTLYQQESAIAVITNN